MSEPEITTAIEPAVRVSTLELFFDLVFVVTLTQLTAVLAEKIDLAGTLRTALIMGIILWMYGGYAWLTNAVAPVNRFRRTLMLIGMGGFLSIALAIPQAYGDDGWVFGLAYFVVNTVHSGLFIVAGGAMAARALTGLAPLNLTSATLILVGGFLPPPWRTVLWVAGFAIQVVSPLLHSIGYFTISAAHFVERHGLVVIIALGESIVAIAVGAAGLELDLRLIAVVALGLTLSYLMYWVYFGEDSDQAEHALAAVPAEKRAMVALRAYGWAHYFLLLGIVVLAAGVKKVIGHAGDHLTTGAASAVAGGLALYLLGDVYFRRVLGIGRVRYRLVAAFVALATIPLGMLLAVTQIVVLIVLVVAMLVIEARRTAAQAPETVG